MNEIETKILEINIDEIRARIEALGAEKIGEARLFVDWYQPKNTVKGKEAWYLRIRNTFDGGYELTWKGKEEAENGIRSVREIHFHLHDHEQMRELLEVFGMELYAHQEKDRSSWRLGQVRFDLDTYPGIPPFLEIEGPDIESVETMIKTLGLSSNERWADGERTLIDGKYKVDWSAMRF